MPKKLNLINQRFGYLTVLEPAPNIGRRTAWKCKCDCGNELVVKTELLTQGKTKSCGCYHQRQHLDLIGKQINQLTVIKQSEIRDSSGRILWECQCSCGDTALVPTKKLLDKTAIYCDNPIHKTNNLIGQQFGHLTVVKDSGQRGKDKQILWECKCDCGNISLVRGQDLRSGNTKSCGCRRNNSFGEEKIANILEMNNVAFEREKSFSSCVFLDSGHQARFDFYLPNFKTVIEYDGVQHFIPGKGVYDNEDKFLKTQEHDKFKAQWCKDNDILLIRIPYSAYDTISIDDLLPNTSDYLDDSKRMCYNRIEKKESGDTI